MTAEEFLKNLASGGAIVSSNDLSAADIEAARAEGRLFTDADGLGYVYEPLEGDD